MNLESDTWDVITSYFRDIPNYLVRHHIDSYNDFIHNKIPLIMKNFSKIPPYVLIDKDDKSITYEIQIYYGGKTHDRYKLIRPTVVNYPSGEVRQLFPNEARLKDITYGFDFAFDIDIEYTMRQGDKIILDKVPSPYSERLRDIPLGKIPIMLRSDMCVLSTASDELLTQMGEDKFDLGGYFILDGAEKVIVSQERKAENIIFLSTINQSSGNEKYSHTAEIKCVSDEAWFESNWKIKVLLLCDWVRIIHY
jgi:DNA-directed RNA polymerase II subunit RPB2